MTLMLDELKARGLLQDISDPEAFTKMPAGSGFYVGIDPTAPSLQIGNLLMIIASVRLAQAGYQSFMLFGGATGFIGDPSGRTSERSLLSAEVVAENVERQKEKVAEIFARAGVATQFINNYEWTAPINVLEFLRDVGKFFTVNYMMAKEVVKSRLGGDGISYTEFSYMLLQAHDFLHLYQNKNVRLQIGGSDQWGNITAGLELIRKKIQGEAYALSWPLILDAQGKKFGKSREGGAIWIDSRATSTYKFHQFWLNVDDATALSYLRVFTFLSLEEISSLEELTNASPEKRSAQKALADAVCTFVHGEEATADANRSAAILFGGADMKGLSDAQLEEIFSDVPSSSIDRADFSTATFIEILVKSGLCKSKGDARRLIGDGGAYLNNERFSELTMPLGETAFSNSELLVLRTGKKNYHLLKVQ